MTDLLTALQSAERGSRALRVVAAAHLLRLTPEETGDPRAVPVIVSAPPPARHANLFAIQPSGPYPFAEDSGFLLSDGTFADRRAAMTLALANGQLAAPTRSDELFSEDLW
jgi:hypothetical protein